MDLRRTRAGEWVAAVGGALLAASLFLPWYGVECGRAPCASPDRSAWEAFSALDVVLAAVAATAVLALLLTATQPTPAVPIAFTSMITLAGGVASGLVLWRVLSPPDVGHVEWGALVALGAVLAVAVGSWRAIREERLSEPGQPTDATGRPMPSEAHYEARTLPPPRTAR